MTTINQQKIIQKNKDFVKNKLEGEGSGHDWQHVERTWKNAILIGKSEDVDMFVVELAALLHDIADWKFCDGDETVGPKIAKDFLCKLNVDQKTADHVAQIIKDISYKGQETKTAMQTKEGKVVQDADRLDAIGAIGVARVFAYGGHKNREIYNPAVKPQVYKTTEEYKNNKAPSINHFYEKLLLLKDRMNTKTGKIIADQRHMFMQNFLEQFYQEVEGKL
jgi:uncharacterized protein